MEDEFSCKVACPNCGREVSPEVCNERLGDDIPCDGCGASIHIADDDENVTLPGWKR